MKNNLMSLIKQTDENITKNEKRKQNVSRSRVNDPTN